MIIDEQKLDAALKRNGIKRSDLCARVGVSSRTVAKIGKGEELRPSIIAKIAGALSTSPEEILRQSGVLATLRRELSVKLSGGLYHETQIRLTYNSNHMEGTRLTEDQTRYIFETRTIGEMTPDIPIDDLLETTNHFKCVDYVIEQAEEPLSEGFIKRVHWLLKFNTKHADLYGAGEYKRHPNTVGGIETASPEEVSREMKALISSYGKKLHPTLEDIIDFHYRFECIHPFQDGNGRVGRLIMFKECLKNDVVPFYIDDRYKNEYYNGLRRWQSEHGYLMETCRLGQDVYKRLLDYFRVEYTSD